jgi:hypothetical protein
MQLYATTTSERASKGQGGKYLDIAITGENGEDVAIILVRNENGRYVVDIIPATMHARSEKISIYKRDLKEKGNNQKGEKPDKYNIILAGLE